MKLPAVARCTALVLAVVFSSSPTVRAVEVVRMHFSTGATPDPQNPQPYDAFNALGAAAFVDLELFDREAPRTVANFLHYIDDGAGNRRYDGTFIHRLVPTSDLPVDGLAVMQGGGFIYEPDVGPFSNFFKSGVRHIQEDAPIVNEPGLSNVRGTIAMAKQANPDSATSEWFFNLTDNAAVLDDPANSGGFTVFGQVLGNGMTQVIDLLDRQSDTDPDYIPTFSFGLPPMPDLPLVDFPPGPARLDQLLMIPRVERVLSIDTSNLDTAFASVQLGATATGTVAVINRRSDPLRIAAVSLLNPGAHAFTVLANTCTAGLMLQAGERCNVTLDFSPVSETLATADLDVSFQNSDLSALSVSISGRGAPLTPKLGAPASVDFGRVFTGASSTRVVELSNDGGQAGDFLVVNAITVSGGSQSPFTLSGAADCTGVQLQFGDSCSFSVTLDTAVIGDWTDVINIAHTAGAAVTIDLHANVTADSDLLLDGVLDFGQVTQNAVTTRQFLVQNVGQTDLELLSFTTSPGFSVDSTRGCGSLSMLTARSGCLLMVDVAAPASGQTLNGQLEVRFDASDPATLTRQLTALAMSDGDGISDLVESAGPNNGDGNFDGIPDSLQEYVTSLPDIHGSYVTLATEQGHRLLNVRSVDNPSPADSPRTAEGALTFAHGFFEFIVDGVTPGGAATVTFRMPRDAAPGAWYMYSATPGNSQPHWYQFGFNGVVGAELPGDRVVLHFVDGQAGDADVAANGQIVDPGGLAVLAAAGSSGGGGGCVALSGRGGKTPAPIELLVLLVLLVLIKGVVKMRPARLGVVRGNSRHTITRNGR